MRVWRWDRGGGGEIENRINRGRFLQARFASFVERSEGYGVIVNLTEEARWKEGTGGGSKGRILYGTSTRHDTGGVSSLSRYDTQTNIL